SSLPSSPQLFNYDPPLILSTLVSGQPVTDGGNTLQVTGNNFGTDGFVNVGGRLCVSTSITQHIIQCTVPSGQGTSNLVQVFVSSQASNTVSYNYLAPSLSQPPSPSNGPTNGNVVITLTGSSFGSSGTVTVGGNPCSIVP